MKYITLLFAFFIIAIVILADRGELGPLGFVYDFPYGDKVGHFVLFGVLNFLVTLTSLRALPNRKPKLLALSIGLILALIIGAEEYSQKFFVRRTFDLVDLTASYLGLIVGGWIALKYKK
ncbi:MAG: VanZ family protein [Anaerolineales bacterium]|nr:VanZ family protein [Anaerolineales bacterium]